MKSSWNVIIFHVGSSSFIAGRSATSFLNAICGSGPLDLC